MLRQSQAFCYDGVCSYAGECNPNATPQKMVWKFYGYYNITDYNSQNCTDGEKLIVKYRIASKNCNAFCGDRDIASCLATGGTWTDSCACPSGKQLVGAQTGDGPLRCEDGCDIIAHQNAGCCTGETNSACCLC